MSATVKVPQRLAHSDAVGSLGSGAGECTVDRLTWYLHMGDAIWEVILRDADTGEYTRVQKGVIRDLEGHSQDYIAFRVLKAAALAMRQGGW